MGWNNGHLATGINQTADNIALDTVVQGDDVETRIVGAIDVGFSATYFGGHIEAFKPGPGPGLRDHAVRVEVFGGDSGGHDAFDAYSAGQFAGIDALNT